MDTQTPTTPKSQSPAPATSEQPKKPYGRNWSKLILIYLAIGAVLYAGVYYFVLAKQSLNPYSQPVNKAHISPSAVSDPAANWKTYKDSDFTFNYPLNWTLQKETLTSVSDPNPNSSDTAVVNFDISKSYKTNNDYINSDYIKSFNPKYKNVTINGLPAIAAIRSGGGQSLSSIAYFVVHNGQGYEIRYVLNLNLSKQIDAKTITDITQLPPITPDILQTFKFTEAKQNLPIPTVSISSPYKTIPTGNTSPSGSFVVAEDNTRGSNLLTVKNAQGAEITNDLYLDNKDAIGYGVKFGCQCGLHFRGWLSNKQFVIYINNGIGEEYEYLVDAQTGKVNESTFRRVK